MCFHLCICTVIVYNVIHTYVFFVGAIAAFVTTPLDVAKTRIMLAKVHTHAHPYAHSAVLATVFKHCCQPMMPRRRKTALAQNLSGFKQPRHAARRRPRWNWDSGVKHSHTHRCIYHRIQIMDSVGKDMFVCMVSIRTEDLLLLLRNFHLKAACHCEVKQRAIVPLLHSVTGLGNSTRAQKRSNV